MFVKLGLRGDDFKKKRPLFRWSFYTVCTGGIHLPQACITRILFSLKLITQVDKFIGLIHFSQLGIYLNESVDGE